MRRVLPVLFALLFTLLSFISIGCGDKTTEIAETKSQLSTNAEDTDYLETYIDKGSSSNPDFDHNSFTRLAFATDNQGNKWALVFTESYYRSDLSAGLFEAHVFEKVRGSQWKKVGGGSGGFSAGVPPEVQKLWGIEGH
jgi:hypothetical protein